MTETPNGPRDPQQNDPSSSPQPGRPPYAGPEIGWPPGWAGLWSKVHVMPTPRINLTGLPEVPEQTA